MRSRTIRSSALILAVLGAGFHSNSAAADQRTWDGDGTLPLDGGLGPWDTSAPRWWDGSEFVAWNNANSDTAYFAGTGAGVFLGTDLTAGGMIFDSNGYQLKPFNGAGSLTLTDSGTGGPGPQTISVTHATDSASIFVPVTASNLIKTGDGNLIFDAQYGSPLANVAAINSNQGTVTFNDSTNAALEVPIPLHGSGNFAATGAGKGLVSLSGNNDFTGRFLWNSGSLRINSNQALGNASTLVIAPGVTSLVTDNHVTISCPVQLNGSPQLYATSYFGQISFNGDISGTGSLRISPFGNNIIYDSLSVTLSGNNSAWTGRLEIDDGTTIAPVSALPTAGQVLIGASNQSTAMLLSRGTLNMGLGSGLGDIRFSGYPSATIEAGYLGATGGPLDVNFGGNATPTTLMWDSLQAYLAADSLPIGAGDNIVTVHNPMNLGVSGSGRRTLTAAGEVHYIGDITSGGAWDLAVEGKGKVVLSGNNSYTGKTIVNGGTLEVGSANAIPAGSLVSFDTFGGTFQVGDRVTAQISAIEAPPLGVRYGIPQYGTVTTVGSGVLVLQGDVNVPAEIGSGNNVVLAGTIDIGSTNHTFFAGTAEAGGSGVSWSGNIRGAGSLTLDGGGQFTASGNSTFSGGVYVKSGRLTVTSSSSFTSANLTSGPLGVGTLHLPDGITLVGEPTVNLGNPISIEGNVSLWPMTLSGPMSLGDQTRTLTLPEYAQGYPPTVAVISGPISGSAGLNVTGVGGLTLSGDNRNLAGTITINSPSLTVAGLNALGSVATHTVLDGQASLKVQGTVNAPDLLLNATAGTPGSLIFGPGLAMATLNGSVHFVNAASFANRLTVTGDVIDDTPGMTGAVTMGQQFSVGSVTAGKLTLNGAVSLLQHSTPRISSVNGLVIPSNSQLDETNNGMLVNYSGVSPFGTIAGWVTQGYNNGKWTGNGMTSSLAAADPAHSAVAVADGADGVVPGLLANQVLTKYTFEGDANIDGKVNIEDMGLLAAHYGQPGPWDAGDFNFDGTVNALDLSILETNYGEGTGLSPEQSAAQFQTDLAQFPQLVGLPEPGSVALLGLIGAGLLLRRRRTAIGR